MILLFIQILPLIFLISGTKGVTRPDGTGTFACPCCGVARPYVRKAVQRYLCFYFLPLIPLKQMGDLFECQRCFREFDDEAVRDFASTYKETLQSEFVEYVKRLMVLTAMSGRDDLAPVSDEVVEAMSSVHQELSGTPLSRAEIEREFYLARLAKSGMAPYTRRFEGVLEERGKLAAIQAVFKVAAARGEHEGALRVHLEQTAAELGVSRERLSQILHGIAAR
jgi:hypothetical protein